MSLADLRKLVLEARDVIESAREELSPEPPRPVVVSGMLAEQLARELAAGAAPGAVMVGDVSSAAGAEVQVHVIAGEPSEADDALVGGADRDGIPVVLVQLWPQAKWISPFVLSPFVVECRAGEGFPVREISDRIAEATEHAPVLASRVPVLTESVARHARREAVARAAYLGFSGARKGASRPLLTMEQVRMLARIRTATAGSTTIEERPLAVGAAAVVVAGFALRNAARRAHGVLPAPLVNAAVAAAGTWAFAKALQTLEARTSL